MSKAHPPLPNLKGHHPDHPHQASKLGLDRLAKQKRLEKELAKGRGDRLPDPRSGVAHGRTLLFRGYK